MINVKQLFSFARQIKVMDYSDKQLQIIETAERLFADKSYDGTSVRDIAEAAGINVAMISYYFGSKEKLLEALFSYRAGDTIQMLESMFKEKQLVPLEKINIIIDYYIDKFQRHQAFFRLMMREQVANRHGVTSALIGHFKKRNQQLVKQVIQEGQKAGQFNKNIDTPVLMATLIGTTGHMISTQHFYREINNLQEMPEEQFQKLIRKKLSVHLKFLFKAILTHEV